MRKRTIVKVFGISLMIGLFVAACEQPDIIKKYTVTYNANGANGTVPESQKVEAGSVVYVAGQGGLTCSGKDFIGWKTTSTGTGNVYTAGSSLKVDADVILYAQWASIIHTVSFNSTGGSTIESKEVNSGAPITRPENPTRSGYTFDNWYSNSGLTTLYNFSTPVTADITLHAKWNSTGTISFTITFDSNEGSTVSNQTVNSGDAAIRPTPPTKSGYTFDNWYSNSGLTTLYNFSTPVTADITLYAKWNTGIISFTITFDSNEGSAVPSQTINSGNAAMRPTQPTRNGYTFDNWYSNSDLTTLYNFSTPVTKDIILYAKWNPVLYTVTFNSGGSNVPNQTIPYGSTAKLPSPAPTRSGYTFDNWYSNSGLTTLYNFSTPVIGDITLYAKWNIIQYTVAFNSNEGSNVPNQTIPYGSTAKLPSPAPTRSGYAFTNWYSNSGLTTVYNFSTSVTNSITLYAGWRLLVKKTITWIDTVYSDTKTWSGVLPAEIEIYALGAGGGGQGGNSAIARWGTGGAGGGGGAAYAKFTVTRSTTFTISIGGSGKEGEVKRVNVGGWEPGEPGDDGGPTEVSWGTDFIRAYGGKGGGGPNKTNRDKSLPGGEGGTGSSSPIQNLIGAPVFAKGGSGSKGDDNSRATSTGGNGGSIIGGSYNFFNVSFPDGTGAFNPIPGIGLIPRNAKGGGGGAGGFDQHQVSYGSSWPSLGPFFASTRGGYGHVVIMVTYDE
ncbi:MAG: InlB B-repeat-containing protein [Treponema sp.]|jgi:uncharacterized repeat protein (TIGR02543 family)|nr:InlB B-repeat-containing protein [Treponema sp.]